MNRTLLSFSTILLAGASLNASPQPESSPEKPNVLFVVFDDLNDWVGPFGGHPQTKTPNFDRVVASNAMVMFNAQSPGTTCGPSRSAMLTGLHLSTTGVYGNSQNLSFSPVAAAVPTMPQYFSRNGYFSLSSGKIFHGHKLPDGSADKGQWAFDLWEEGGSTFRVGTKPLNKIPSPGIQGFPDWGPTTNSKQQTGDWVTAQWAVSQINAGFNKPFFMMVGLYRPHLPWYVPQEYFDRFDLETTIVPDRREDDLDDILTPSGAKKFSPSDDYNLIKKHNAFKEAAHAYLASISYVDDCLGLILDALDNSPYKDNTIIVLTGDHGWFLGEKLRYRKNHLWEEACRVPLIVKVPGMTAPAKTKAVVNLLDLYPTLAELCGLPVPEHCDGRSFVPVLQNPEIQWYPTLITNAYKDHSVRSERYRYNLWNDGTEELYDHYVDSMEWNNLAKDPAYTAIINEHKAYLPTYNAPPSIKDEDVTSINQLTNKELYSLFPSVFKNKITLTTPLTLNSTIEVFNMQGVKIETFHNFQGGELDLSRLSKGSYILKIDDRIQISAYKIMKI
jgi:arylsulfatase A-like enzyme